ncbi:putative transcription factor subunit (nucleomorph) [Guillardia theta]|uniref:Transcription factor subunit n=1 Tax=Guillardia theta TaxID=55529 RepID=Q98RL3_GUITH|nr:putative transcription factor subunit [Guillardia theta]AAK39935.1 putative transcription factor subunit [Guillardia theta]|mmetsp:Transcript_10733/g.36006  ORF Transcript_10733/g.36006 Transcript_10733/m.36006 type:complete len:331 (-) Transcript_10733:3940-4932(-)
MKCNFSKKKEFHFNRDTLKDKKKTKNIMKDNYNTIIDPALKRSDFINYHNLNKNIILLKIFFLRNSNVVQKSINSRRSLLKIKYKSINDFEYNYKKKLKILYKFNSIFLNEKKFLSNFEISNIYHVSNFILPSFFAKKDIFRFDKLSKNLNKSLNISVPISDSEKKNLGLDCRSLEKNNLKVKNDIDFFDKSPVKPDDCNIINMNTKPPKIIIGYLIRLFKKRPIWNLKILKNFIPLSLRKYLKDTLLLVSYKFKRKNPFHENWIRYGYDPRNDKKSYLYQNFKSIPKNYKLNFKKPNNNAQICDLSPLRQNSKSFIFSSIFNLSNGWLL